MGQYHCVHQHVFTAIAGLREYACRRDTKRGQPVACITYVVVCQRDRRAYHDALVVGGSGMSYTATNLGFLPGGSLSLAIRCSANGSVVVGAAFDADSVQRAVYWDASN